MIYDIIVIGAGSGGLNIASFMNRIGFKVLLVDRSDANIGGDCLNFGCVPSKALIHVARMISNAKKANEFGLKSSGSVNLKKVMSYVKEKQSVIREHENAEYLRIIGMDVVLGDAKFTSKNSIKVNNNVYEGKKIVVATGSSPRVLDIPGSKRTKQLNNENIFNLEKIPKKLVVIGAGPIGIEMGQAFNMLGSKVTIVHNSSQILSKENPEISEVLLEKLIEDGIEFVFDANPKKFTSKKELVVVKSDAKEVKIPFNEVFVSIGRNTSISNLGLDKANIEVNGGRIVVDDYLRTTNKKVFVCGDVAGAYQFTHAAEIQAGLILRNFFSPLKKKINYDSISWVIYSSPEIATFGLDEKRLQNRKIKYKKLELGFGGDDRAIVDDYTKGKVIVYVSKNRIIGGSMIAPNAGELIQELILADASKLNIKELFNKTYPYPTASRINKKLVSLYFSNKLTSFNKKILRLLYV